MKKTNSTSKKETKRKVKKEKLVIEIKENKNTMDYLKKANRNTLWRMTVPSNDPKIIAEKALYYAELKENQKNTIEEHNLDLKYLPEIEPDFLKLYIHDVTSMFKISKSAEDVFMAIINKGFVDIRGVVELTPLKKDTLNLKILKSKDESRSGFNKALIELQRPIPELGDAAIFIPLPRNDYDAPNVERYKVNDLVLGTGNWLNIRERRLRIVLDYGPEFGRKIKIETNVQNEKKDIILPAIENQDFNDVGDAPFETPNPIPYGNKEYTKSDKSFNDDIPM